jgi:hypothetical protein
VSSPLRKRGCAVSLNALLHLQKKTPAQPTIKACRALRLFSPKIDHRAVLYSANSHAVKQQTPLGAVALAVFSALCVPKTDKRNRLPLFFRISGMAFCAMFGIYFILGGNT